MSSNRIFLSIGAHMTHPKPPGQHYLILKNHHFLTEELTPDQLPLFKLMTEKLASLLDFHQKYPRISTPSWLDRLREILKAVEGSSGQDLLAKTFRKLAIVHIFLHKAAEGGYLSESLAESALAAVEAIQEKDLKSLTKSRGGVLREIGQLLQNLGNRSEDPLPIQQQPARGVMRQLVEKVYRPFCLYLQRIIQDRQSYSLALRAKTPCCPQLQWKVINLSKHLGGIIMELNRICRYFRKDLLGVYSHFIFLITLDASQYYDLIRMELSSRCQILREKIEIMQALKGEDYGAYQKEKDGFLMAQGFIEARRQLEELSAIREGLVWVYLNKQLRDCIKHFRRPINGIQLEINRSTGHITSLLAFIDRQHFSSTTKARPRRTSIQLQQSVDIGQKWEDVQISTGLSLEEGEGHFD